MPCILLSRYPRSTGKSYLALILDQEKTIIFGRLSRRLEVSVGNAWSRSMRSPNSRLSTDEIISFQRRSTAPNPKRNAKVEHSLSILSLRLSTESPMILKASPLRTHDSALRYITVASLDKRLCRKRRKKNRLLSG